MDFIVNQKHAISGRVLHECDWMEVSLLMQLLKPLADSATQMSAFLIPTLQSGRLVLSSVKKPLRKVVADPETVGFAGIPENYMHLDISIF